MLHCTTMNETCIIFVGQQCRVYVVILRTLHYVEIGRVMGENSRTLQPSKASSTVCQLSAITLGVLITNNKV